MNKLDILKVSLFLLPLFISIILEFIQNILKIEMKKGLKKFIKNFMIVLNVVCIIQGLLIFTDQSPDGYWNSILGVSNIILAILNLVNVIPTYRWIFSVLILIGHMVFNNHIIIRLLSLPEFVEYE